MGSIRAESIQSNIVDAWQIYFVIILEQSLTKVKPFSSRRVPNHNPLRLKDTTFHPSDVAGLLGSIGLIAAALGNVLADVSGGLFAVHAHKIRHTRGMCCH